MTQPLVVAVFPGAANAPLYHGLDHGWFSDVGLEVEVVQVRSSTEQMSLWDEGRCKVMHTSPDHLVRAPRAREPMIVRRDAFGELSVYRRRPGTVDLRTVAWAVDGPDSGFAFVLRALLEDRCNLPAGEQRLVPVGGTKERFEALLSGASEVGGTTLHPPFDELADEAGCARIAGHFELMPELLTLVTAVPVAETGSDAIRSYLAVMDRAVAALAAGGAEPIAEALERHGLPAVAAAAGAMGMLGPGGLREERAPSLDGLEAVARLRSRFDTGWTTPGDLAQMIDPLDLTVGGRP